MDKVTVITVCYNSSKTILETIESVNTQDYPNLEHIFIDGNSQDATLEIIQKHSIRNRVILSEGDEGIYDAMNKGITISSGKVIFILNSDDIFYSNSSVSDVMKIFEKDKDLGIVYGSIIISKKNDLRSPKRVWIVSEFIQGSFKLGWHPPHPAFVVKKQCYENFGKFDTNFSIASDFEIMHRFLEVHKVKAKKIDKILTIQRGGGRSMKVKGIWIGMKEINFTINKDSKYISLFIFLIKRYFFKLKQYLK